MTKRVTRPCSLQLVLSDIHTKFELNMCKFEFTIDSQIRILIQNNPKLLMWMKLYETHIPDFFQTSTIICLWEISKNVKQSEKKFQIPDLDPDQQNSAKFFKSPHKEAA